MFMLILFRYITGYVYFSGVGIFPERFINLCASHGIILWKTRIDMGKFSGCMKANDYKSIIPIARKSNMKLKITKKVGFSFICNRYRHRYGIFIGAVLFFFICIYFSGFVFNISIVGNSKIQDKQILNALQKQGVSIGVRAKSIDTENTRQRLLIDNKELSWAAININGCFVTVDVRETTQREMVESEKEPCNIVAKSDGEIVSIKSYNGETKVKQGEKVNKGDLLVSGVITLRNNTTKFLCARAKIMAKTTHNVSVFVPFKQVAKLKTDEYTHSVLNLFGVKIPLFLGEVKQPYRVSREEKSFEFDGVELPISLTKAHFSKLESKKITVNKSQAIAQAKIKISKKAEKNFGKTIKKAYDERISVQNNGIKLQKIFICEEDIATSKKILKER